MKRAPFVCLLLASTLMAYSATSEVASYRARMDHAQDLKDAIRDALDGKNGKKAARLGTELTILLQQDEQYWEQHEVGDAVALGKTSVLLSKEMTAASKSARLPAAMKSYLKLQDTCRSCHDAHPEKQAKP